MHKITAALSKLATLPAEMEHVGAAEGAEALMVKSSNGSVQSFGEWHAACCIRLTRLQSAYADAEQKGDDWLPDEYEVDELEQEASHAETCIRKWLMEGQQPEAFFSAAPCVTPFVQQALHTSLVPHLDTSPLIAGI